MTGQRIGLNSAVRCLCRGRWVRYRPSSETVTELPRSATLIVLTAVMGLAFGTSGCALQAPLSEGLVFGEAGARSRIQANPPPLLHPTELGLPISATLPSARVVRRATPDDTDARAARAWRRSFPIPGVVLVPTDRVAFGFSPASALLGSVPDVTVRLAGPTFVTATSAAFFSSYEVILQRRVLTTHGGGLGLGVYHRREQFGIEGRELEPTARFAVRSVGGRASFQLPLGSRPPALVRGFVNVGYALDYGAPMAAAGASVSVRVKR